MVDQKVGGWAFILGVLIAIIAGVVCLIALFGLLIWAISIS